MEKDRVEHMGEERRPREAGAGAPLQLPVSFRTVVDCFRFSLITLCSWIVRKDFGCAG